ncbi:hypothetical protein EIL87_23175 [Saccharopolyspora rhizosphaerae]|uniref:DUF3558 domain-containing protein n=1 Tax=Saccharopolyspora rhizosphaerae TaxID=2492662 RepID=A0A3R8PV13_9PSEU|nr:hypothetical protein [Saccharopolyspora rhizosphaerae]RRO12614.1 hypothetical protein EIL87_23175 [Saccharopolyspora rhizosphaerae]
MSPRRHLGMLLLLCCALLAGCTAQTSTPTSRSEPVDTSAKAMLGDLRTLDPCTLTDPAALQHHGSVSQAGTVSLDYCLLHVRPDDRTLVQVAVGELVGPEDSNPGDPVVQHGSLRISHSAPAPGHCTRRVQFGDGVSMQVSADLLEGGHTTGLCGIAETGAKVAADAVQQGRAGHRDHPPHSLALHDPCAVLDTEVVNQVPGLEEARPRPSVAGHQCSWGEPSADSPRVQLQHTAGEPPRLLHGAAVEEEVAGRRTVLSVVGGDPQVPLCSAETSHIPYGTVAGQVEVAQLVVALPGMTGTDACDYARGLARLAWPSLPPAHP